MKAIKILLGIIAVNLTLITLIQLEIFPPKAYANEINTSTTPINTNYGLVPLNEDGSIDVNCHVWNVYGYWTKMTQP